MPGIHARFFRSKEQFGVVEMMDSTVVTDEYVEGGKLVSFRILALIVAIVGVRSRRQETQVLPAAAAGGFADACNRRFGDDNKIDSLPYMRGRTVQSVQD